MGLFLKFSAVLVFITALWLKPYPISCQLYPGEEEVLLKIHNEARAQVKVGPISWDDKLESYAKKLVKAAESNCVLPERPKGGPYGENTAGGYAAFSAFDAAGFWVAEKGNYDYASNKCLNYHQCEHYTQVVWRNSTRIGCAGVFCATGWPLIVCEYDPPGNIPSQRPH